CRAASQGTARTLLSNARLPRGCRRCATGRAVACLARPRTLRAAKLGPDVAGQDRDQQLSAARRTPAKTTAVAPSRASSRSAPPARRAALGVRLDRALSGRVARARGSHNGARGAL